MKANSLSSSQFADRVGIKRSNLSHVLSGRNKPSLDFLSKVIVAYPNVNASWLITGETREGDFKGENKKAAKAVAEKAASKREGVERIVVFYANGTFSEYTPNER